MQKQEFEKKCTICKEVRSIHLFGKDKSRGDGYCAKCKKCAKEYTLQNKEIRKNYHEDYRSENRESINKKARVFYLDNKEYILEDAKKYYLKNKTKINDYNHLYYLENKDKISKTRKEYDIKNKDVLKVKASDKYFENRDAILKQRKEKYAHEKSLRPPKKKKDPVYAKMMLRLRQRISIAVRNQYGVKAYSSIELLGCTVQECRDHLEKQFTKGMNWDNHSRKGWHIDHIKPCAAFDLTDPEQQKECFHYTNIQPLWAVDNLKKRFSDQEKYNLKVNQYGSI